MKNTKKVYRTAMGKEIDMQTLQLMNEKAVALGNANMNARGDQIDARGNIIKKREDLVQEYYRANPKAVRDEQLEEDNVTEEKVQKNTKMATVPAATAPIPVTVSEAETAEFDEHDDVANAYASDIIKNKER